MSENQNNTYIADHKERIKRNMLSRWWKTRILALTQDAIGQSVQDIEDAAMDIKTSMVLSKASGVFLDIWGAIVGEQRLGLNDERYRYVIEARISAERSNGTVDECIFVYKTLLNTDEVRYHGHFPASFKLVGSTELEMNAAYKRRVRRIMDIAKAAGIGLSLAYYEAAGQAFQLDVSNLDISGLAGSIP